MKVNGKSIAITAVLAVVLIAVILVEISLFISGPARSYEAKIANQEKAITDKYQDIEHLTRHVFKYIVYIGDDDENIVWFNEEADAIVSKEKSTLQMDKALQTASQAYGLENSEAVLGYGYDNPVYLITSGDVEVMLDYDTLKVVHYRNKGAAA